MKKHNYKGGSIASNGYKIIYVGKEHHLSDSRGYAYEHRIIAEEKVGRKLKPNERVHHKDENKLNNHPDNLEVTKTAKHHMLLHRKKKEGLRMPDEENVLVKCLCGCGEEFMKYDGDGRERKYVSGHNPPPENITEKYILSFLSNGEQPLSEVIKNYSGGKSIKTVMGKLCKKGSVIKISRGIYKLK